MSSAIPRRVPSLLVALVALILAACSGDSNPTAPSATPPPSTPQTIAVNGYVGDQSNGAPLGNATVRASSGQETTTRGDGYYELTGLTAGSVTIAAFADRYNSRSRTLTASGTQRVDLELIPFFSRSGRGNTVFDMPQVPNMRVRIRGRWDGRSNSNFILRIGGRLVVNEILRQTITYDGLHETNGGTVEITNSNNIDWSITQEQ